MRRDQPTTSPTRIADDGGPFAALSMYPLEALRPAWDRLYGVVARGVVDAPDGLRWDIDVHDTWLHPRLVVGMSCGWPLVTQLQHSVRVVGTFLYALDDDVGHTYRSVIIAREPARLDDLSAGTLAFNSTDSLSGYVSIVAALAGAHTAWPGPAVETGAHLASIQAVREGRADVASIDAMTWAYTQRDAPAMSDGLVVIGRGPTVPHLPIIVPADASDDALAGWRVAFADAVREPALAETLDQLMIHGFVALDLEDYEVALQPLRRMGL